MEDVEKELEVRFRKPPSWTDGTFTNARGLKLRFGQAACHKKPLAHIVYIAGISEFAEKSYELARDFNNNACNFSTFDRPGQGRSPRLLADPHKQHSTGNRHSVQDVIDFCKKHVPAGEPVVLLGHSTGGLVALQALHEAPETFAAAILCGPLFGINNPAVRGRECLVAKLELPRWIRESYIPGGGPWKPRSGPDSSMKPEEFSSDAARGAIHEYWQEKDPALQAGSVTCGWVLEKCRAITRVMNPQYLKEIKTPLLVFTGGRDTMVRNDRIAEAVRHLPDARLVHFPEGGHEMLMEKDAIRDVLLYREAIPFLQNRLR